ncbi:MAG: hypothetical protein MJ202_11165 [Lentisphaeria bacterium]|nr:hypothetical protein [Lentisphaeria bacterium]
MNNDICSKIQEMLLLEQEAKTRPSPEVHAHLAHCEECRKFAATLSAVLPPKPSAELDAITLARCKAAQRMPRTLVRSWHRIWAAAASIAILFAIVFFGTKEHHRPPQPAVIADSDSDLQFEEMLLDTEISLPQKDLENANLELGLFVCDL